MIWFFLSTVIDTDVVVVIVVFVNDKCNCLFLNAWCHIHGTKMFSVCVHFINKCSGSWTWLSSSGKIDWRCFDVVNCIETEIPTHYANQIEIRPIRKRDNRYSNYRVKTTVIFMAKWETHKEKIKRLNYGIRVVHINDLLPKKKLPTINVHLHFGYAFH